MGHREEVMIGCLILAFALCQVPAQGYYVTAQGYTQQYAQGYYQQQAYYPQQQVYYPQPVYYYPQPVYVAQPIAQPYYGGGGGYGYQNPFGGISVAVGPRGGVRVGVGR
jgi:hypothetical protein